MADDIQVEEFNRGDSAQDDRLRPGDGGTAGGTNTNADLREKGDADDLAEAVIQGDAEGATRDIGLRSDSPVDLTREEADRNPQQAPDDADNGPAIDPLQNSRVDETTENNPVSENASGPERNITERTVSRTEDTTIHSDEVPAEPVAPAIREGQNAASVAPAAAVQGAQAADVPTTEAEAEAEAEPETEALPKEKSAGEVGAERFVQTGETFQGGDGDDSYIGSNRGDFISGGGGNDVLQGGNGKDFIAGNDGDDKLFGNQGHDTLVGGAGDDLLDGGQGHDTLIGDDGNDVLDGGTGRDTLIGGDGNDVLDGGTGRDTLIGGQGDDTLIGGSGRDTFVFEENFGNDIIADFGTGKDTIDLSALGIDGFDALMLNAHTDGDSTVIKTEHGSITLKGVSLSDLSPDDFEFGERPVVNDTIDAPTDTVSEPPPVNETPLEPPVDNTEDPIVDVTGDDPPVDVVTDESLKLDGGNGDDTLVGAGGNDTLAGNNGDDLLSGGAGDDSLHGGNGNDILDGGAGDDFLDGGNGKDIINGGTGNDTLTGDNGADTFTFGENFGNDVITDFTPGSDQIDVAALGITDLPSLLDNAAMNGLDTVITTSNGTITLTATNLEDLSVDDFMFSDAATDTGTDTSADATVESVLDDIADVFADDGHTGTAGDDTGGTSTDGSASDPVVGDTGGDTGGETGGDTGGVATQPDATGSGDDATDPAVDTPTDAGSGPVVDPVVEPVVDGIDVDGGNGKDDLEGGAGNDALDGGNGKDILNGGAGDDTLTGGNGNDTFAFGPGFGNDTITDFKPGNDQIDLSSVGVPDMETLLVNATMVGNDAVITTDQGTITLSDVNLNDLSAGDFTFGDAPATTPTPPAVDDTTGDTTGNTGGTGGDAPAGDGDTGTTGGTDGSASDPVVGDIGGETGGVATQPDTTGTGGDAPAGDGDTATTGGTDGSASDPVVGDTGGDTGGETGGDTGGVATQPDATGSGDDTTDPAVDTSTDAGSNPVVDPVVDPVVEPVVDGIDVDGGNGKDDLEGGAGNDALDGGNGKDILNGGAGDDTLTGGNGNDTFAFDPGFGNDTITDFKPGNDQIDLSSVGVPDMETLLDNATMVGNDAVITTDQGTITLSDVNLNDLSAGDFTFGDAPAATPTPPAVDDTTGDTTSNTGDTPTDGDTGSVATQPDTTGTGGDTPAGDGDTVTTGGNAGDPVIGDTTGGETGGDTGGVAAQPDTTGTGGDTPAGDTGGNAPTGDGDTGTTGDDQQADTTGDTPPVADTPVSQPPAPTIEGDSGSNDIDGSDGVDVVNAGSGDDRVETGGGDDIIDAGTGDDRVKGGDGNDTISGGTGNDRLDGGDGEDVLAGGEGTDTLYGGGGSDTLGGGEGSDYLNAGQGDDVISGGSGDDKALGGDGNDTVDGGDGNDSVYGNNGDDNVSAGAGDDRAFGGSGDDTVSGGDGNDEVHGNSGNDFLDGGSGDDTLHGGSGEDEMAGGDGTDRLSGGTGADTMDGGAGEDRLYGGSGDDVIDGGAGDDYLKGDSGADTFTFSGDFGNDFVSDFDVRESDAINLSDTEIGDFRTLMDNSRQDGNDTIIELDGGTITLNDVDRNELTSDNFAFAENAGMELSEPGSAHEIPDLPAYSNQNVTAETANGVDPNAVTVSSAQTVTMTFEGETAGYQSSVGHYTVDADGVIQGVEMAWENASEQGGGGDLVGGEEQVSFDVDAGARVGVFVVPNGHQQNDFSEMTDGHFEFRDDAGEPATINTPSPTLVFVHDDGNETTINSQSGEIFHSAGPDMHGDSLEHSISGVNEDGDLMIGFEDLVGGGDESYDDLVVKLEFEPIMDKAEPAPADSAFSDGSGGVAGSDMVSTDFDFIDDVSDGEEAGDEAVFNLDFTDLIPEGADEGQFEVRVSGLPSQVSSSKGEVDSDRNWTLTMMQVVGLTIAVPTAASAVDLMEDITFQVVETESGNVVAEGLLDGDALDAGETTISVLPQAVEEERGNNGKARGHDKQEEKAAAEEAEAASASPAPVEEDGAPAAAVDHAAAPEVTEEVIAELEEETEELVEEAVEEAAAPVSNDTVAEANVAPTDLDIDTSTVAENATNGTVVGMVSTTDSTSGETFTYTLTDDAGGRFAIDPNTGEVTVANTGLLDFETATSHDVTVQVTDSGGNTYSEVMAINIADGNDTPTDLSITASTVTENAANGTAVGTVSTTDPDAGETFTYTLTDNAGGRFAIDTTTGVVTVADGSLLDFETSNSHNVTVRVTDSGGNTYDEVMAVSVTNGNDTPTDMSISANTVAENAANTTVVGTVSTTDQDAGETYTYTLTNDQGGRFAIDVNTGVVTVADGSKLDYETLAAHDITVRVTDSGGATYDETMTINLTNVNETPTDLKMTNVEIAEGAANGTVVGTAAVTDNAGDTAAYTLTDNAGGRFTINSSTGEITVANGSLLDYESSTSHDITVRITDGGGNTYDETFTIGLNDEAEQSNSYEAEIVSHDPVGYWKMDEVNGSSADHTMAATVGGNDATMHNTDTGTENNGLGGISNAMTDFYGDDYMVVPDDAAYQLTDGTVQLLFKAEDVSGQNVLLSRDSDNTNEGDFKIHLDGDDVVVTLRGTNGGSLTASNVITQNSWYQIDVTFGADGLEIWLNGTRVANDPSITGGIDGTTEPWVVGASSSNTTTGDFISDNAQWESDLGGFFNGDIGEFAIFDSQLDSTAINDIYDAGVNGEDLQTLTAGNDSDSGSTGVDMINGGAGDDTLAGHDGDDFLYGGDGDDTLDGGSHDDVISGGDGNDTVTYAGFGSGVTVNLETGTATDGGGGTDTLSGIENVIGTGSADNITGDSADNVLTGAGGNDVISGGGGDDTIYGGTGDDTLNGNDGDDTFQGGVGDDIMTGGAGTDTVTYDGAAIGVNVNLHTGTATDGSGDTDTLSGIENLIGSANDDTFTGNVSVNEFTGGDGSDRFIMGEGGTMDTVHGGAGGGWTDTLQLMNTDASAVGGGWTVQLTTGSVANDDGSTMTLTDDAAGTITLDDGSQIAFDGLEKIEY